MNIANLIEFATNPVSVRNSIISRKRVDAFTTAKQAFLLGIVVFLLVLGCSKIVIASELQLHRNDQWGFRMSYPPSWKSVPTKGTNVRFAATASGNGGNCNVTVIVDHETSSVEQSILNDDVRQWALDKNAWPRLFGTEPQRLVVLSSRVGSIYGVTALIATAETHLENLAGKFLRKQDVAVLLTPGRMWVLNCGVSSVDEAQARARYAELRTEFNLIFASFAFLQ
jgi:hypothetical protein